MNHTPSELLKMCVARSLQDASLVFVGDDMPKGMAGMKNNANSNNNGGNGGGMNEANAGEESLDEHIKHWHKGVAPEQPCAWMLKHGYGQGKEMGANKGGQSGGQSGNFDQSVKMTPVTQQEIKQADGALKRQNGPLDLKTQQGADNVAQIERLYAQAKTPQQKSAIDRIYKNLQTKLGRNPTDEEFNNAHADDIAKTEELKRQVAEENERLAQEEADNKRADGLRAEKQAHLKERIANLKRDYKEEFDNLVYLTKNKDAEGNTLSEKNFESRSRKLENWFFNEMDKLEAEGKQIEAMTPKQLNDELREKVKRLQSSGYVPRARRNATPAMRKFQAALKAATDVHHETYKERISRGMKNGIKAMLGADDGDWTKIKEGAKQLWKAYKERPLKSGKNPSEGFSVLRKVLGGVEKGWNAMHNEERKLFSPIVDAVKKAYTIEPDIQIREQPKNVVEKPKKSDSLRRLHGSVANAKSPEAEALIDEIENEFANAKSSDEKLKIMKKFMTLQNMLGGKADYTPTEETEEVKSESQDKPKAQTQETSTSTNTSDDGANSWIKQVHRAKYPSKLPSINGVTDYEKKLLAKIESEYNKAMQEKNGKKLIAAKQMYDEFAASKKDLQGIGEEDEFNAKESGVIGNY